MGPEPATAGRHSLEMASSEAKDSPLVHFIPHKGFCILVWHLQQPVPHVTMLTWVHNILGLQGGAGERGGHGQQAQQALPLP